MSDTSARRGVLAAGNYLVDQVKTIDVWPEQDTLASIRNLQQGNGGGPYNVLKDLAKAGADYPLTGLGRIGKDPLGSFILDDLAKHRIDASRMIVDRLAPTSYTDVMTVQSDGRRTFFHMKGANAELDADDFDFSESNHRIFYLGYLALLDKLDRFDETGRSGAARVLESARANGLLTLADTVSAEHPRFANIIDSALPHLDALVLNEWEAGKATGRSLQPNGRIAIEEVEHAADELLERGKLKIVVIHFPDGAFGQTSAGERILQAAVDLPAHRIKGAVGAGDAFCAGIVHGLHEEQDLATMLATAVCLAATCLSDPTTSDGIESFSDCIAKSRNLGYKSLP